MTPDQIKAQIRGEYIILLNRADAEKINKSAIYGIISSRCREGARHNGQPSLWKLYLPEELRYE